MIKPNFREIFMGKISQNTLYRSEHPIQNIGQKNDIISHLQNANIKTIINLSDNAQSLKSKLICYDAPWYQKIFDENNVIAVQMNMKYNLSDPGFMNKIKSALDFMSKRDPPYLIHCEMGVDRTGILALLLEAFMSSSLEDMAKDYMLSFVDEEEYHENDFKNGSHFISNVFSDIKGYPITPKDDFQNLSEEFLYKNIGIDIDTLATVKKKLTKNSWGGGGNKTNEHIIDMHKNLFQRIFKKQSM